MALKPFFGVFALYLLWRRDWRAVAGIVIGGLVCLAVGLLAMQGDIYASWIATLREINWHAILGNVSIRGIAARWFSAPPQQPYVVTTTPIVVSRAAEMLFWIGGAAFVTLATARCVGRTDDRDRVWAVLSLAALLLSPLAEVYYVIVGFGPIALTLARDRRWLFAWLTGVAISLPYALVNALHWGVLGTMTVGSVYGWATAALWAGLLRPPAANFVMPRTDP